MEFNHTYFGGIDEEDEEAVNKQEDFEEEYNTNRPAYRHLDEYN